MKKKTFCGFMMLAAALLLANCTVDVLAPAVVPGTAEDDSMSVSFRVSEQLNFTRTAKSIVTFNANENVKVFVKPNGADIYSDYTFRTASAGQSNVLLTAPDMPPYFPAGAGTKVQAYAYYPASAVSGETFCVADDQTGDDNYKASDLMFATNRTITKGSAEGTNLAMSHLMAQLHLNVTATELTVNRVLITAKRNVTFSVSDAGVASTTLTEDAASDIVAATASGNAFVCIPVQPINTVTVKVETGEQGDAATTATFTFTSTSNFEAGNSYPMNLTVSAAQLGATTAITDWNGMQSATIAPTGNLTIEPISAVTYNGSAQTPALTVKKGVTMLTAGTDYDVEWFNNTNVGIAIAVVRAKDATYQGSVAVAKFTIEKADAEVTTAPTKITGLTYSGSSQSLVTAGIGTGGTLNYKLDDGDWGTSVPSAVNANTSGYSVSYYVEGDANHNSTDPVTISSIAIAKTDPTYTAPTIKPTYYNGGSQQIYYNGGSQQIINAGTCTGGTMSYKLGSDSWTTDATEIVVTSAGNYTVYWKVDGDANHNDVAEASFAVAVTSYPLMSSATSSDVGKVICSNGHIHSTVSDVYCGGTASGIIAYVGTAGTADKSSGSGSYKGLALALYDCGGYPTVDWGRNYSWGTTLGSTCIPNGQSSAVSTAIGTTGDFGKGIDNTNRLATAACGSGHEHAAAQAARNFVDARPSGASQWFMPTLYQWNLMVKAMCGKSANLTTSQNNDYTTAQFNVKIIAAGGRGVNDSGCCWCSVEYDTNNAWTFNINQGKASSNYKSNGGGLRAVFAF